MHVNVLSNLTDNSSGAVAAASTSAIATASYLAGALPIPDGTNPSLTLTLTILGPVLTLVVTRLLSARAAKKRALAALNLKRANEKRKDGDPANDKEADVLEERAIELQAEADGLEALKPKE